MNNFKEISECELMEIVGGKNQEWYDMGKDIGHAVHQAADAVGKAFNSVVKEVKSWF